MVINALSALRGGGQTYLFNLLSHSKNIDVGQKITVLANAKNADLFKKYESDSVEVVVAKLASINIVFRVFWEFFILPFWLLRHKHKEYYAPGGIMVSFMPPSCKSFTALRNMLPFDKKECQRFPFLSYIRFKLWILKYVFLLSYHMSDGVVFISNFSRDVIEEYIPKIKRKSVVIHHGINENFRCGDTTLELNSDYKLDSGKYYLYVSILDVYKAQKEVIDSWKRLVKGGFQYPLILVGPKYSDYGEEVSLIVEQDSSGLIRYLGPVEYQNLPNLYQNSRALIFASSCECCPNILLEKLSAKKPVLCSSIQPMPEFGGDAVVYFDPYNTNDLYNSILEMEKNEEYMEELSTKSYLKSLSYNWENTTRDTFSYLLSKTIN
jgi:glycosyltransferase involved in cell wall biosynthesis